MDYKTIFQKDNIDVKLDILAFAAHPDDIELACSATLIKHIISGKKVGIIDLTQGELGTRGNSEIRMLEAINSAKILDIEVRHNLLFEDGFFEHSKSNILKIIKFIRKYKPEYVCCNATSDRHIDHGRASKLVSEACFLSGLNKIKSNFEGENQESFRPKQVLHYIQDRYLEPNFVIDVSDYVDKKMQCISSYKSQFFNPNSNEPSTPISGEDFIEFILARMSEFGRRIGVRYAEGFIVERTIGVDNFFDLI